MMVKFLPNQMVWIHNGDTEQNETGIVVRVGCIVENEDGSDASGNGNRTPNKNGVEIRFPVSGERRIVDASMLRILDDTEQNENSNKQLSRRRTIRTLGKEEVTVIPSSLVTPEPVPGTKRGKKQTKERICTSKPLDSVPKNLQEIKKNNENTTTDVKKGTSSPYFAKTKSSRSDESDLGTDVDDDDYDSDNPKTSATKKSVKRKLSNLKSKQVSKAITKQVTGVSPIPVDSDTSDEPDAKKVVKKKARTTKKVKEEDSLNVTEISKTTKTTKKSSVAMIERIPSNSEDEVTDEDADPGNDDDSFVDREFTVECAASGRATCRTCDEIIAKDSLRVSHVPLFRGKPGYIVYRHLHCSVFSENVKTPHDVKGWRKLKKSDFQLLVSQIETSKRMVKKENEEIQPDELVQADFQGEVRDTPQGLCGASLLPFQIEGTSWMYHQEYHVEDIRGGILADEMGMGKTIQTIATMLDNRPLLQHSKPGMKHPPSASDISVRKREETLWGKALAEWKHEMEMNKISSKLVSRKSAPRAGTLVICPLIALSQWKTEIEKFTEPGALTVCIYHGTDRASQMPIQTLTKYDVVLTTFQVIEQDFRKMVSPNKVRCPNCNTKFKIDKLRVHLKYFCGENAQKTEAQARQRRGDRRQDSNRPPSDNGVKGKGKTKKTHGSEPVKKTFKVKKTKGYDSDSELSIIEETMKTANTCRPCRTAASVASKRVSASAKDWKDTGSNGSSSSSYASESDGSDSESNSDVPLAKGKQTKIIASKNGKNGALEQARKKQEIAMQSAKKMKKTSDEKKSPMKKGKKSVADSKSCENDNPPVPSDPLAGIDLEELMEEAMAGSVQSPLHSVTWWRIVLDEAHFIKSRSSQTAAAAFALTSIHRWCLSGTPLQNRVGELYSLIRFLRIDPMALYFCRQKDCTCKSLHYRMLHGVCQDCGHRSFSHFAHFNKHILTPIQRDGYAGDGRRAMFKLKNDILDKCLLRRTKETRAADMKLPPRLVTIRYVRLHPIEEDFYQSLYTETKASFDDYVQAGTLMNNYAHIFDLLTKMRQATSHPYMVVHTKSKKNVYNGNNAVANGSAYCDICHEPPTDRVLSICCGAGFCRSCVIEYISGSGGGRTPCPSCNAPFTVDLSQARVDDTIDDGVLTVPIGGKGYTSATDMPSLKEMHHVATGSILRRINLAEFATSTKIEVLLQELILMRKKRPGSKALVFSQFVNMLDLVRWRIHSDPCLADLGLGVQIIHGGMPVAARDDALKVFREDSNCRVLLMSLKAAGVALNLTVASECYLLDLWWNPAAEMQAIDRTHRLGQYRPIRAVRLVAEGTVEERILQLQEKKRLLFDGTVGRDAGSLKMLTVDDMAALFM